MKSKIFDRYGRVSAVDHKYTGEEPTWDGSESWDAAKFMKERSRMFNFYNYYCSSKDLFPDLLAWMKSNAYTKEQVRQVKAEGERIISFSCLKIARAMNLGMPATHEGSLEYSKSMPGISANEAHDDAALLKEEIARIIKINDNRVKLQTVKSDEEEIIKVISPLERLSNKVNNTIISELEVMIDEKDWSGSQTKVDGLNLISLMKANDIPVKGLKEIYDWLHRYEESLQGALDKTNEFDIEGWAFCSKAGVRNRLKTIQDMITQLDKYSNSNKKKKAPRKREKAAASQVKNLKYQESDDNFGVRSVSPLSLPGARKILTFNTKNRKLNVYVADSPIEVKGTTLKGWDESQSYSLTLRKPDDIIPVLLNKTERQFTKVIDALTTKRGTVNGRVNKDTILLRTL